MVHFCLPKKLVESLPHAEKVWCKNLKTLGKLNFDLCVFVVVKQKAALETEAKVTILEAGVADVSTQASGS